MSGADGIVHGGTIVLPRAEDLRIVRIVVMRRWMRSTVVLFACAACGVAGTPKPAPAPSTPPSARPPPAASLGSAPSQRELEQAREHEQRKERERQERAEREPSAAEVEEGERFDRAFPLIEPLKAISPPLSIDKILDLVPAKNRESNARERLENLPGDVPPVLHAKMGPGNRFHVLIIALSNDGLSQSLVVLDDKAQKRDQKPLFRSYFPRRGNALTHDFRQEKDNPVDELVISRNPSPSVCDMPEVVDFYRITEQGRLGLVLSQLRSHTTDTLRRHDVLDRFDFDPAKNTLLIRRVIPENDEVLPRRLLYSPGAGRYLPVKS